jgi:hypothetical protein
MPQSMQAPRTPTPPHLAHQRGHARSRLQAVLDLGKLKVVHEAGHASDGLVLGALAVRPPSDLPPAEIGVQRPVAEARDAVRDASDAHCRSKHRPRNARYRSEAADAHGREESEPSRAAVRGLETQGEVDGGATRADGCQGVGPDQMAGPLVVLLDVNVEDAEPVRGAARRLTSLEALEVGHALFAFAEGEREVRRRLAEAALRSEARDPVDLDLDQLEDGKPVRVVCLHPLLRVCASRAHEFRASSQA